MKEVRRIQIDRVRNMCIRNDYYTSGTCEEYGAMFEMCKVENPTTDDFERIARDIFNHSDKEKLLERVGMQSRSFIRECIMFELINDCTIVHIED